VIPSIDHFIGQVDAIAQFRVALEASWADGTRLPHILMVGPPGVGKTSLAHLAAKETCVALHERIGQVLNSMGAVNGLLCGAQDKDIVFIDEIHEMPKQCQTLLYRALEDRTIFLTGRDRKTFSLPVANFSLIAATTDEYSILPPLRDRFKVILPFRFYDLRSLSTITKQRAKMMGIELQPEVAEQIAMRSRGTPRLAIRLLESCHRLTRSVGATEVTMPHFERATQLEQIDSLGLDEPSQRYLNVLAQRCGEPVRLHTLEAMLGVHRRTLQTVIEPFLIRAGLIERTQHGRQIVEKGLRHLGLMADATESTAT